MATNISNIVLQTGANLPAVSLVNGDTLNLAASGLIMNTGTGNAPGVLAAGNNILNINGDIFSFEAFGINATGGNNVFNIAATATVFGLLQGIRMAGANNVVNNAGDIGSPSGGVLVFDGASATVNNSGNVRSGNSDAIFLGGNNSSVTNSGNVDSGGGAAIQANGDNFTFINSGFLRGDSEGIDVDGGTVAGVTAFFNTGTVIGVDDEGYDGDSARDFITNNGVIQGATFAVRLAGGDDVYDGRNGSLVGGAQGGVDGGDGNDVIFGGIGGENLQGGIGNDLIFGGGGGDTILGGDGLDVLYGGAGGDIVRGGLGTDLIGFNLGDNGDLIQNFNEGGVRDGFDLRGYFDATGFAGTNPRAAGIMAVLQNGADTDVYLHGAFAFRIQGVVAAAIDDTYFLFQ